MSRINIVSSFQRTEITTRQENERVILCVLQSTRLTLATNESLNVALVLELLTPEQALQLASSLEAAAQRAISARECAA